MPTHGLVDGLELDGQADAALVKVVARAHRHAQKESEIRSMARKVKTRDIACALPRPRPLPGFPQPRGLRSRAQHAGHDRPMAALVDKQSNGQYLGHGDGACIRDLGHVGEAPRRGAQLHPSLPPVPSPVTSPHRWTSSPHHNTPLHPTYRPSSATPLIR